jgi:ubiquinone/menaquinone biosynthesis C-methylase UbiE
VRHGQQLAGDGKAWGTWDVPESELHVLGEVAGRDLSEEQLRHAGRLAADMGVDLTLMQADAEAVPLAAGGFDIVFCGHGAMNFADPTGPFP